jgi:hypothetical protein
MFTLRTAGACAVLTVAVACLALASSSSGQVAKRAVWTPPYLQNTWAGTWSTDWGEMTLSGSGAGVDGHYTHDSGHIAGKLNGSALMIAPRTGTVMTGRWDEAPTRKGPNDAGPVVLTMQRDGHHFTGKWAYDGSASSWHANWSGTCIAGDCLLNAAAVPVSSVSNGCGGEGWDSIVAIENYIGNSSTYKDSNVNPLAKSYTVSFVAACNLHDAGYAGAVVRDTLSGRIEDFRTWSRKQVDDKFLADMRLLCARQIPAAATTALANCKARGGNLSFGAVSRYNVVRKFGHLFFDADLTKPGTQKTGERPND